MPVNLCVFFYIHTNKIGKNQISSSATLFPFLCALTFFMYFSPEVLKSEPYGEKADVWAAGCILYQMATLSPPFCSTNMLSLATKVGPKAQKGPLKLTATPCSLQNPCDLWSCQAEASISWFPTQASLFSLI